MTPARWLAGLAIGIVLGDRSVLAQVAEDDARIWEFSASVFTYLVPDVPDYAQPTFTFDRDWLHLEARYNYESLQTGSVWIGGNFSVGESVTLDITPMVGGVFGEVNGVAPGYKAALGWRTLELASESEFMFDTGDTSGSFLYTWSELSWAPVGWLRLGLVTQRTKAYETDFDIQRGFLMGFAYKVVDLTTYVFNPDAHSPTVVLAVGLSF